MVSVTRISLLVLIGLALNSCSMLVPFYQDFKADADIELEYHHHNQKKEEPKSS